MFLRYEEYSDEKSTKEENHKPVIRMMLILLHEFMFGTKFTFQQEKRTKLEIENEDKNK